jgi:asparagine synthase (glutamine-hydrolysing)
MCGIAGLVYEGKRDPKASSTVRRMIALQRHRGPDGEGFYDSAGVSLGHCRLAIIDLTDTGHQPMSDADGQLWITFNGEIYNYLELGEELRSLGYRFQGQSDTEVLLAAYKIWGSACLERLRGMFAFCIWDERTKSLFAARDRLGIKPFHYWTEGNEKLGFASEIKALLGFMRQRYPNVRQAQDFLAWNLLDHDLAETMVSGIRRLPAAHAMYWHAGQGIKLWKYWSLSISDDYRTSTDEESALIAEFRERFEKSISVHLRSDVPVGTSLSGGLDSSAIACVVSAELRKRGAWRNNWQHTFSAYFPGILDERPYINAVVAATGCTPHYVLPQGESLGREFDTWLWHQDEPVGSPAVYAQYCVARLAKEHGIKVLLDGQGADEMLAGYRKFILVYLRELLHTHRYVKAGMEAAAFFFRPEVLKTTKFIDGRRYLLSSLNEVTALWPDSLCPQRPNAMGIGHSLARRLEADIGSYSLPVLLRYDDRNMMAFGVESRVPFVDHVLVEWVAKLPTALRLSGGWTKRIVRESLRNILPESIRTRRSKLYFSAPESAWLAGPLSGWLRNTLEKPRHLPEVVDVRRVHLLLARRTAGDRSLPIENMLFRLAIYECWARQSLEAGNRALNYHENDGVMQSIPQQPLLS